jgi:hypothetical protein
MKRFLLALAMLMVFSFGLAQAADIELVGGKPTTGWYAPDTVQMDALVTFTFQLTNNYSCAMVAFTNGFEVYTTQSVANPGDPPNTYFDAVTGQGTAYDTLEIPNGWLYYTGHTLGKFDDVFWVENSANGQGIDTVGPGGVWTSGKAPGIAAGWSGPVWWVATTPHVEGDTLCIDSAWFRPSNDWIWSMMPPCDPASQFPTFGGPYCYHVYNVPNLPPVFDNCLPSNTYNHCSLASYDFDAHDQDTITGTVTYSYISGPKTTFNTATGAWTYQPTLADVGTSQQICVGADDGAGGTATCCMSLNFTNVAPTCVCLPDTPVVGYGQSKTVTCTGNKVDCDPIFWFADLSPSPNASFAQNGDNGELTFSPKAVNDTVGIYCFTLGVTDTKDTSYCVKCFKVVSIIPKWDVVIENATNAIPGQFKDVCVWVESTPTAVKFGGFDMLLAYDASVLNFQGATKGTIFTECAWEYFTYRFGPFGNCGNQCPSGMLRVVGMAEVNNGPYHPTCFGNPDPGVPFSLFCMTFYVTNSSLYDCMYFPIRFFWFDCGDNTLSSKDGDTLWISKNVYDKVGFEPPQGYDTTQVWSWAHGIPYSYTEITDIAWDANNDGVPEYFPTYTGAQEMCDDTVGWYWGCITEDQQGNCIDSEYLPKAPIRDINFFNGGIDVMCVDTMDDRGDINLNGVKNEIADAVMFTNYFIYGLDVFHINRLAQIAATDINADGLTLSVADLVYLVRIIVGDALPYPKLAPVTANYTNDGGVLSIDAQMGAAYAVIQGNVTPELLASQMDIKYAYDAEANVTRVLVYSLEGHGFSGEFLNANGNVVSIELGSYEGAVVKLNNIPANFALNQNYPNPFNPTTMISFNLPVASDYTLTIYNVTGQQVAMFTDRAEAGTVEIEWNASTMASGVYFYKLTAGNFSDTKKMVLLK